MWWRDAVVYQIYPRSFQDSDGDGIGDLAGIRSRLDHLQWLGVDALWLSPVYPSPLADFGYDITDHMGVDPVFGTLAEYDALVDEAHARGLRVLMDLVPCHTSIEHHWFRDHPERYVWADRPNNWAAAFGGSAWTRRDGRYYLHSFYSEQPDLDWRNPEVIAGMQEVVRFWLGRGVDGYRVDAIDRLLKDPQLRDDPPATAPPPLPVSPAEAKLALRHSRNAPDTAQALAEIRAAAGDALLVGEVYLPAAQWQPYLEQLDAAFAFELLHVRWDAQALRAAVAASTRVPGAAWVMSNHDFGRLASRFGEANARVALLLLLTLPGAAFLYQGDEIGQPDGPGGERGFDRAGRDAYRHPMQWDGTPRGGFSEGSPWLPVVDAPERNVADQRDDPGSQLTFVRELIALRRTLGEGFVLLDDAAPGTLVYERGDRLVALNPGERPRPAPAGVGAPLLETVPGAVRDGLLGPHAGAVFAAPRLG
jgi:alpha-glucosidase